MLTLLQRFDSFVGLSGAELANVADHALAIKVPAGRWLWREGRRLPGSYYLVEGRVRVLAPPRTISHRSPASREPLYPGHAAVRTLSAVRLLHVDTRSLALLLGQPSGDVQEDGLEPWEQRLLSSPLMRQLDASGWQKLFSELKASPFAAGENLVTEGDPAAEFFVLKTGRAVVRRGGDVLAQLSPGDFFGEDALIVNGRRNATVAALEAGSVLRLPKDRFMALLLDRVVRFVATVDAGVDLDLSTSYSVAELRGAIKGMDPSKRYRIIGGQPEERALAAFILVQKGFDAWAVNDPAT